MLSDGEARTVPQAPRAEAETVPALPPAPFFDTLLATQAEPDTRPRDTQARRRFSLGLALAVLCALAHALAFVGAGPVDDDYIAYRYADHLAHGQGLTFNPPERVEGYSAPLWVLLLAAALRLGADAAATSVALGVLASAAAVWATAVAWRALRPGAAVPWPALVLAASAALAWHSVAGLGTTLLAALLALWLASYATAERERRPAHAACVWLALACALRAEAVLFAVPFAVLEVRRVRRAWPLLVFVPLAGWQVFRWAYYARLVPVTWLVKKLALGDDLVFGLRYLWRATLDGAIGVLVLGIALLLAARWRRLPAAVRAAGLGALAYALYVVAVGGDHVPLARFFVPVLSPLVLLTCLALHELLRRARVRAACGLALAALLARADLARGELFALHAFGEERWAAIGAALHSRAPAGTRVAASPVGAIGYESRLAVIDILGCTNDVIWRTPPDTSISMKGHQRYDPEYVLAQRPDVVILGNGVLQPGSQCLELCHWERSLFRHPRFRREYSVWCMPVEGSYELPYFQRRGGKTPAGARPIERVRER